MLWVVLVLKRVLRAILMSGNNIRHAGSEIISPSHKRTEGRASVWGSEFTTKAATLQGDSEEISPTMNVK